MLLSKDQTLRVVFEYDIAFKIITSQLEDVRYTPALDQNTATPQPVFLH